MKHHETYILSNLVHIPGPFPLPFFFAAPSHHSKYRKGGSASTDVENEGEEEIQPGHQNTQDIKLDPGILPSNISKCVKGSLCLSLPIAIVKSILF